VRLRAVQRSSFSLRRCVEFEVRRVLPDDHDERGSSDSLSIDAVDPNRRFFRL
jgi:hypothetical protein